MEEGNAYIRNTYGKDSEQILASAFGVVNPRNKTVQQKIDAAYDAIRKGDMGKAENLLSEITDIVGMDDPVVSRIKLEMARKNRLAK